MILGPDMKTTHLGIDCHYRGLWVWVFFVVVYIFFLTFYFAYTYIHPAQDDSEIHLLNTLNIWSEQSALSKFALCHLRCGRYRRCRPRLKGVHVTEYTWSRCTYSIKISLSTGQGVNVYWRAMSGDSLWEVQD